jgi:osmoprotectant transport system substrate-binding protein
VAHFISALISVCILLASACTSGSNPQSRGPDDPSAIRPIVVGSFDFSESRILAEVYASALEHHGYPVKRLSKVATREIMEPALEQEFVDLVLEYQGTALAFLSRGSAPAALDPQATHALLAETLTPRGITVLDFASAQDRNEVVVARSTADRLGVETISDLQDVASEMVLGGPPECPGRPLCLQGLEDMYGLDFEAFLPLDAGGPLTVAALEGGEIDVAILFTTSPAILAKDFVVLEDDLHLQPAENVVPIVRQQILDIHGPKLAHLLNSVTARLSTKTLRELNQQVELEGEDPAAVARDWLDHEGLDR